jgi:hypothetical protein
LDDLDDDDDTDEHSEDVEEDNPVVDEEDDVVLPGSETWAYDFNENDNPVDGWARDCDDLKAQLRKDTFRSLFTNTEEDRGGAQEEDGVDIREEEGAGISEEDGADINSMDEAETSGRHDEETGDTDGVHIKEEDWDEEVETEKNTHVYLRYRLIEDGVVKEEGAR